MPTNKNVFIRYKFLDRLFSDSHHYYDRKALQGKSVNTKGLNLTLFKNSRRFYLLYPQIGILFGKSPTPSDFLAAGQSNNEMDSMI